MSVPASQGAVLRENASGRPGGGFGVTRSTHNVLHLIDTGGPGGAETIFLELATGLDPHRWSSIVVVPERDWLESALRERGVEPFVVASEGSFDLGYVRRLDALMRRHRVDIVQTHLLSTSVYASVAARFRRIPVVAALHGAADVAPDERFRRAKFGLLRRRRNRLVFVSDALRRWYVETQGVREASTRVVHNGVDLEHFAPGRDDAFRRELGIGPDEVLVGALGNLRRPKRYDVFLRMAAALRTRSPRYRFAVVGQGDGPLRDELLTLRTALGLEDVVTFAGFRGDVRRVLRAFDVYALSSEFEGFSLTTLQAVACGVPVVATRSGGPQEIVDEGVSGTLVPPGDPGALAEAIHRTVTRERRAGGDRITHRRRAPVDRFSLHAMASAYESLYRECLDSGAAAR